MEIYVDIDVEKLPYPCTLGVNKCKEARDIKHGCMVCHVLLERGIVKQPTPIYEILLAISDCPEYNEICLSSPHCSNILSKFQNGSYKAKYAGGDGDDDIYIELVNDEYRVWEGKHRVCVAKRFGIKKLPVILNK